MLCVCFDHRGFLSAHEDDQEELRNKIKSTFLQVKNFYLLLCSIEFVNSFEER